MISASRALTVFHGRAGDHNDRAMAAASRWQTELEQRLATTAVAVGRPEPALNSSWDVELAAAIPQLRTMARRYDEIYAAGEVPVSAMNRCAVALATLPVVARYHPDAVVVWFDAHGDFNTPQTSSSGYLGGMALSGPAGLWDSGLGAGLASTNIVLGGTRDIDLAEQELLDGHSVPVLPPGGDLVSHLRTVVNDRPVYFHLDCDVLEPGTVPTDYRAPGGLSLPDLRAVAETLARNEVVGIELAEFEADWQDDSDLESMRALLDALQPLWS